MLTHHAEPVSKRPHPRMYYILNHRSGRRQGNSSSLHGSPAAAVAFYDPRLGTVVVATHSKEWAVGQVVDVTLPKE